MSTASPGWYPDPDPVHRGGWRWWDGWQWGPSSAPANQLTVHDVESETSAGSWAKRALVAQALMQALSLVVLPVLVHGMRTMFHQIQTNAETGSTDGSTIKPPRSMFLMQPLSLIGMAAVVVLIVWMYRSSTNAERMGLHLRRSPALAAAGFIIPIVNFWWPYQAAVDLVPPDASERRHARWWWGSYIASSVLSATVVVLSLVSPAWVVAPAAVDVVVLSAMVVHGRALIDVAGRIHATAAA